MEREAGRRITLLSIVLIDSTGGKGTTATMLEMAVKRQTGMVLEVITPNKFRRATIDRSFANAAIFIPVSQAGLSSTGAAPKITPALAQSLELGQIAARKDGKAILVNQPGDSLITGVDAGAALVAGIAGIVDDRVLLMDGVIKSLLTHQHIHPRWRKMLAMGETAGRLRNVKTMFEDWDEDVSSDYSQYAPCFKACMALAQLERLSPLRGQGHRYSYVQLARALNLAEPETSFHLSEVDLRKVLSIVANRLMPVGHDESERVHLPTLVKSKWEFPDDLPVVEGFSDREISQVLYEACRSMEITAPGLNLGCSHCVVRLPTRKTS